MGGVLEICGFDCLLMFININRAVFRDSIAHEILIVVSFFFYVLVKLTFFRYRISMKSPPFQAFPRGAGTIKALMMFSIADIPYERTLFQVSVPRSLDECSLHSPISICNKLKKISLFVSFVHSRKCWGRMEAYNARESQAKGRDNGKKFFYVAKLES